MKRSTRIGIFAAVMAVVSSTLFRPVRVEGDSMLPTYQENDFLLTAPILGELSQGDIVVFEDPTSGKSLIKRVLGLPGYAPIESDQNSGAVVTHTQIWGLAKDAGEGLPSDHFFLIGDNPSSSTDSRQFGPVPRNRIHSRVVAKIWSAPEPGISGG